ncbi:MAG: hypothetical protein V2B14_01340 [bacterium]
MPRIWCHRRNQKAELFKIVPTRENIQEEFILYLKSCEVCNRPALEIIRVDVWGTLLEPARLKSKNIKKFLDSMSVIWKPKNFGFYQRGFSRFMLGYNEYGLHKKCFQNFSNLKIGIIETDPYLDLRLSRFNRLLILPK